MAENTKLDRIDFEILNLLLKNSRTTNKDLAESVGVAPSTCLERVRKLVDSGAIRGFHADIDPAVLGIGLQAIIAVRLKHHMRTMVDSFHDYLMDLPEVRGVFHITGSDDYLVHVGVKGSDHLRDLALDSFTTRPEVDHIQTRLIFEYSPTWRIPFLE